MTEPSPRMSIIISAFSYIPLVIYFFVAIMLTIVAIASLFDCAMLIWKLILTEDFAKNLYPVITSILLTITVIVLFETVTVYFRTKHVPVRALLVAGLTGTIRQVLIINYTPVETTQLLATIGILAVLIAGVVLVKEE